MTTIMQSDPKNPWRPAMLPAKFRDAPFFVESSSKRGGRRLVDHEFPKLDTPYLEDLGRRGMTVTVRAYCIQYPSNSNQGVEGAPGYNPGYPLFQRDYRLARDRLEARLLDGQYGLLQLPYPPSAEASVNWQAFTVGCESYTLQEEERQGGYCVFDITFREAGALPNQQVDAINQLQQSFNAFINQVQTQAATPNQLVQDAFSALPPAPTPPTDNIPSRRRYYSLTAAQHGQGRFNRSKIYLRPSSNRTLGRSANGRPIGR